MCSAASLVLVMATLSAACASTPAVAPSAPVVEQATKPRETAKAKTPNLAHEATPAPIEPTEPAVATPDVSYEDAMKAVESEISDEGLLISECNVVGGGLAMGCHLDGTATAKFVVQDGVIKGVTIETSPPQPRTEKCMRSAIAEVTFRAAKAPTGCVRTFKMSK